MALIKCPFPNYFFKTNLSGSSSTLIWQVLQTCQINVEPAREKSSLLAINIYQGYLFISSRQRFGSSVWGSKFFKVGTLGVVILLGECRDHTKRVVYVSLFEDVLLKKIKVSEVFSFFTWKLILIWLKRFQTFISW